jgi:PAS domain S-box-containing protein
MEITISNNAKKPLFKKHTQIPDDGGVIGHGELTPTLLGRSLSVFYIVQDNKFKVVNPMFTRILGFSKEELLESEPLRIVHPNDQAMVRKKAVQMLKGKRSKPYEFRCIDKGGKVHYILEAVTSILYNGKRATLGSWVDFTEGKKVEETLRESEERFRAIFENSHDGIFVIDLQTKRFNLCNKATCQMLGYSQEEIKNLKVTDIQGNKRLPHTSENIEGSLLTKVPRTGNNIFKRDNYVDNYDSNESSFTFSGREYLASIFQDVIKKKDGSLLHTEITPFFITLGGSKYLAAIFRDITERKKAEEKINQAAEQWQTTFNSITDWIYIIDKEFKLVRVNKAFANAIGRSQRELIGKTCYEIIHKTSGPILICPHKKVALTREPFTTEYFEAGLGIYLDLTISPIINEKGDITGTVHVARDVSERKRMQEQLILTDRLASIGELASGIAHEINNPLTSIITSSQLLMEKDINDDIKEDVNIVYSEARRTAGIVKNLLTFAQKHPPLKQIAKVHDIIEEVLKIRSYNQQLNNIIIQKQYASDLPEIMVDYFQIQQAFFNIIINAEYFMTKANNGGTLNILTEKVNGIIRISFTDDGPGIKKENLSRLFTPFFTTKEVGKGTGLGLSICHGIVAEHGGRIYARSEDRKGATFIIELPNIGRQL